MNKIFAYIYTTFTLLCCLLLVIVVVKGDINDNGLLSNQENYKSILGGPFESSGSNSRYALVEAIVKRKSYTFNESEAALATPDLVSHNGKYFSIFAPGVSMLTVPFYWLGSIFRAPQLTSFFATTIVAIINAVLIYYLVYRFVEGRIPAFLASFIFIFGSNALTYAATLTQHHWSILCLLLTVITTASKPTIYRNMLVGFLYGLGALIDIPNTIILLPFVLLTLNHHFSFSLAKYSLRINVILPFLLAGLIPILIIYASYNEQVTGSYYKLGQFLGRSEYPPANEEVGKIDNQDSYDPVLPFNTRLMLNGIYILLVSNERGLFYYSPIMIIGLIGLFSMANNRKWGSIAKSMIASVVVTLLLYSAFGDPWGGWSFGPRYLLPSIALISIGIGYSVNKWRQSIWFGLLFLALSWYSIYVSSLGAFTTTLVPPKQEADRLAVFIPYTWEYNKQLVFDGLSTSLVHNIWLHKYVTLFALVAIHQGIAGGIILLAYLRFYKLSLYNRNYRI